MNRQTINQLARSTPVHIAFAFVAMGGWALFANLGHGLSAALAPAVAQGTLSGLLTALLKRTLEAMSTRLCGYRGYIVPPVVTAGVILAVLSVVHWLIGTPEIAHTVAVPWSVSTFYAVFYTVALRRRIGHLA